MPFDITSFLIGTKSSSGGGGSTNILSGKDTPTASVGSDGDVYLQYFDAISSITNIRMVIYACKGGENSNTQVTEVQLLDINGDPISWGSGTATSNGNVYVSSQTAEKAFNNVTNDKWYTNSIPSANSPIWIDFAPDTPLASFYGWRWYTGDDSTNRDPITFDLQVSTDNGSNYITVDSVSNATITTSRNSVGYTNANVTGIIAAYCKVNGEWQDLIGTDIDDVNT